MLLSSWSLYFRDTCITFPIFHHDLIANFNLMKQDPQENNIQLHIMNRYLYLQYSHTYLPYWVPNGYLILQNNKGNYFSRLKVLFFSVNISQKKLCPFCYYYKYYSKMFPIFIAYTCWVPWWKSCLSTKLYGVLL